MPFYMHAHTEGTIQGKKCRKLHLVLYITVCGCSTDISAFPSAGSVRHFFAWLARIRSMKMCTNDWEQNWKNAS